MKEDETAKTVILNKDDGDGFLDLHSPRELFEVMKALKRIGESEHEEQ